MKKTKKLAPNRRLVYAIVALLGSLTLWVYVRTAVNPYSDPWVYRVPVVFEGVDALTDRSLILLAGENATVDLHLYGKLRDTATLNRSNITLTVELLAGSGATDADATCTIKPESIRIAGDAELLKGVNQISLGSIDLGEVYGQATLKRSIVIPNDMQNLSGEEEASITVELKGLDTRTIRTSNIELINKPNEDTQEYTVISSSLSVVVRGKSAVVEEIYPANLRVVADLSEYDEPGQYKVPVTVYVDGYADVGILHEGDYAIVVSITQKQRGTAEGS